MQNININLNTGKKRFIINDDENKVIEFNPEDMRTRKKFYEASKTIFSKKREFDIKFNNLQQDDIYGAFALEEELFEMIENIIDEIFGAGTTKMLTDGATDCITPCNFITAIAPYFKKVNEEQKNKYTNNLKSAGLI